MTIGKEVDTVSIERIAQSILFVREQRWHRMPSSPVRWPSWNGVMRRTTRRSSEYSKPFMR
jgi:hypothetical protein